MASSPHVHFKDEEKVVNQAVVKFVHHDIHLQSASSSAVAVVNTIHQLQTEVQAQHQHEKRELTELNERFRVFIDRVQLLESENLKYLTKITEFRKAFSYSDVDIKWSERYLNLQTDLSTIGYTKIDYDFEFEMFQLQIGIFQQLLELEQKWKDEARLALEAQLKEATSALSTLRASYGEKEREIAILYTAREDTFKQYLSVTTSWCDCMKERKKWDFTIQILKSEVLCYKSLHTHTARELELIKVETTETKEFWTFEFQKCVKKIRSDFETLYAAMYHQMTSYYEVKMEQLETDVEEALHYQKLEMEEIAASYKRVQIEYEEAQKSLSSEIQIANELEAMFLKLESELKSLEIHHEEQYAAQEDIIINAQENITVIAYNINEMHRRTKYLETEIIIYRHLLDSNEIQEQVVIVRPPQIIVNETVERFVVESETERKGSIGIKECATSGKYIILMNHSTIKAMDISKWILKRRTDSKPAIQYIIPAGTTLQPSQELIIYSQLGIKESVSEHHLIQKLVYNELVTWDMGNKTETILYNQKGEEKASLEQTVVFN